MHLRQLVETLRLEGTLAREQPVEQHAERVEVRLSVDGPAGELLGRRVGERADELTVARDLVERFEQPRGPEVEELHASVALHQHVRRLQIAVDDAALVEVVERIGDGAHDADHLQRSPRCAGPSARLGVDLGGDAVEELHRQIGLALVREPEAVDAHDVRVVEPRQRPVLAIEARNGQARLREELEREPLVARGVLDLVHRRHPAPRERADHPVRADGIRLE